MSVADEALGEPQPRQLIVTVYGLYAPRRRTAGCPSPGWSGCWRELGVGPQAVRSSISRLKRRDSCAASGWTAAPGTRCPRRCSRSCARATGASSSTRPRRRPTAGSRSCSRVPEAQRDQAARAAHPAGPARLRAGGARRLGRARARWPTRSRGSARPAGLAGYVDLFRGEPPRLRRRWPSGCASGGTCPASRPRYAEFVAAHRPLARRIARRPPSGAGGLRRLRPDAHRLAAAALPRPGPAAGPAAGAVERRRRGRAVRASWTQRLRPPADGGTRREVTRRGLTAARDRPASPRSPAPRPAPRRPTAGRRRCRPWPGSRCRPAAARPAPISRACAR